MRYHQNQNFVPIDQKAHEAGNRGHEVPDYCATCGWPFMSHDNGRCPVEEEET